MMETILFSSMFHQPDSATLHGEVGAAATVLYPGANVRLKWDPKQQRLCVYCGQPATEWGEDVTNLDGETFTNSYGTDAEDKESVCQDHKGRINPCTFHGQQNYAPGCTVKNPRCHRMFSECRNATVYLAATDKSLQTSIKVGQTLLRAGDSEEDQMEENSLRRRVANGGYGIAIPIIPTEGDLWLGSAQLLERSIREYCYIPEKFFHGQPSKTTAIPYFVADTDDAQLVKAAHGVLAELKRRAPKFQPRVRPLIENLTLGEITRNPHENLIDKEAVRALDPQRIQSVTLRRKPQDIRFEVLGIRGKYVLGREHETGDGVLLNTKSIQGLHLGVEEL